MGQQLDTRKMPVLVRLATFQIACATQVHASNKHSPVPFLLTTTCTLCRPGSPCSLSLQISLCHLQPSITARCTLKYIDRAEKPANAHFFPSRCSNECIKPSYATAWAMRSLSSRHKAHRCLVALSVHQNLSLGLCLRSLQFPAHCFQHVLGITFSSLTFCPSNQRSTRSGRHEYHHR